MLKEKLEEMREKNGRFPLVCLSGSETAKREWLAAGGTAGHTLSPSQVNAILMTGAALPEELAFEGTLTEFIRLFPLHNAEESKKQVNRFLEGGVAEWTAETAGWEFFTCRAAVLGCCMGEYLSILNRKDA